MAGHAHDEVEEAFRHYWQVGAVGEDWKAWAALFTDDATYVEHVLGNMHGASEITPWITSIMADYSELYTVYEWHVIDGDRVVFYMQNRRDNPEPGGPPIDLPGISILHYAGDGKWSYEEDFWAVPAAGAEAAGLPDTGSLADLVGRADLVLCICPPEAAREVAASVVAAGFAGLYVDANAVSPATAAAIGRAVEGAGCRFVDGDLI